MIVFVENSVVVWTVRDGADLQTVVLAFRVLSHAGE